MWRHSLSTLGRHAGSSRLVFARALQSTPMVRNDVIKTPEPDKDPVSPLANPEAGAESPVPPSPEVAPPPVQDKEEKMELTPEEIRAERKARKELKKKKKAGKKKVDLEEDEVEKKKRERREKNNRLVYHGDGSEIDLDDDNLDDHAIMERIQKMFDTDNDRDLLKLRKQHEQEKREVGSLLPSMRYWALHNIDPNPYYRIRFNQAFSKWSGSDLRRLSNEEYQDQKYNTLVRMHATDQYYQIFPDIIKKFTPTINLLAEYNHPLARDILVYYGNIIPAEFTEEAPKITFRGLSDSLYTLMLVDAKNPVYLENYDPTIQWMITNIPGSGEISQGNELVEYAGATPLKNELPNRMVFLLFRQRFGRIEPALSIKADQLHEREPFNANEFALQNHLQPRGMSFYNATYDRSVASRFAKFGVGEPQFISEEHIRRKAQRKDRTDATKEATSNKWTWPTPSQKE